MKKTCYYLILFFVLQSCKNKTTENLQNNVNQNHFGTENAEINEIENSQAAVTYTDIFTFDSDIIDGQQRLTILMILLMMEIRKGIFYEVIVAKFNGKLTPYSLLEMVKLLKQQIG